MSVRDQEASANMSYGVRGGDLEDLDLRCVDLATLNWKTFLSVLLKRLSLTMGLTGCKVTEMSSGKITLRHSETTC